ncbi:MULTISPECIES: hypothetical protein [Pseudomonas]|uniref:Uncharacterized protein n=1 Tax=Pseudomonas poae TaxID=200451 RepID=A0AAP2WHW4_9PSED|nr:MULTISPECIES: hypothetical protein [Pseudomonas]ELQ19129.1 hypothetical protein A986_01594 [Pseudomonas fluorescens BRIP34879]KTC42716.1 hypothetical protein AO260_25155 [Pseudomonas sp. ABAC21]AGE25884.1 hypothetical protein H045_09070 [Pseudomonas poae RE*1-1-14]KRP54520.1 hypothetical protein TU75_00325 [Pseudomonas poae]MBC3195631.1 hypothetical protein [Pseudomonas poae]
MFIRGTTYKAWAEKALEEECFTQEVENGCHIEVRARERKDDDIEVLVCVYTATGDCVGERVSQLPGAQWTVHDALKRGIDQAERIAGGESGRLPCADAHVRDDD